MPTVWEELKKKAEAEAGMTGLVNQPPTGPYSSGPAGQASEVSMPPYSGGLTVPQMRAGANAAVPTNTGTGDMDWQAWETLLDQTGNIDMATAIVLGRPGGREWLIGHGLAKPDSGGGSDPALLALQREQLEWQKRSDTLNAYIDELHEKVYSEQITREEALKQLELQIDANTAAQTARREASQWAVDPNAKFFPGFEPQGVVGQVFQKSSGMPFPGLSTTPVKTSPSAITNPLANIKNTPIDTNALAEQAWADVKAKAGI